MTGHPELFDRLLLRRRRARAAREGGGRNADFLLRRASADIAERLAFINRPFPRALALGAGAGVIAADIGSLPGVGVTVMAENWGGAARTDGKLQIVCDEELLPLAPASLDLVASALSLHDVNDLPGVLAQIRTALKPDGLFIAALLGGDTLQELRHALTEAEAELTGGAGLRVSPFADLRDLGALLGRAGFALPVADLDRVAVTYPNVLALMHDLRAMGATNVLKERTRRPLTRDMLALTDSILHRDYSDGRGRFKVTFDIVTLTGWAPHESQQQPLRPGSAAARLADALTAEEISAGEKARPARD